MTYRWPRKKQGSERSLDGPILSRLTAAGYQEPGRFHLLDPTADYGPRKMAWVPPAYSGQRVFARNDKELVCASLASAPTNAPVK